MALRKHGHARDPAARREAVKVDLKKRRPRRRGSVAQRRPDYLDVVKIRRLPEIDDKMRSGEAQAISLDEVVVDGAAWHDMKSRALSNPIGMAQTGLFMIDVETVRERSHADARRVFHSILHVADTLPVTCQDGPPLPRGGSREPQFA